MKTATPNEVEFLKAIIASEYHDGQPPVGNHVWMDCLAGWESQAKAGTVASLVAKGFVALGGDHKDETICITQEGYAAVVARLEEEKTLPDCECGAPRKVSEILAGGSVIYVPTCECDVYDGHPSQRRE